MIGFLLRRELFLKAKIGAELQIPLSDLLYISAQYGRRNIA